MKEILTQFNDLMAPKSRKTAVASKSPAPSIVVTEVEVVPVSSDVQATQTVPVSEALAEVVPFNPLELAKLIAKLQRTSTKTAKAVAAIQEQLAINSGQPPPVPKVKEPSGFARPTRLAPALTAFLGIPDDTRLARTEVTKRLGIYIKANELQAPDNKRNIIPDKKLKELLKLPEGHVLTFFNVQKFTKDLFLPNEPVAEQVEVET
jgi:chromatin remodeling complex protein RSC6